MASVLRSVWVCGSLVLLGGCVTDPKVEDERVPTVGAHQPETNGTSISAAEACEKLKEAAEAARDRLDCDAPDDIVCPGYVYLAGATPCDEYDEGSVDACVEELSEYDSCSDFTRKPCVATLTLDSCTPPVPPPDAGADADGAADGGDGGDGGAEAGDGGAPEGGPDGGDAATEAGPDASDAGDAATDASDAAVE